jgi:hypothetical protein
LIKIYSAISLRNNIGRRYTHQELPGDGIAFPITLGELRSHVASGDTRGPICKVFGLLLYVGTSFNDHKGIRGRLVIHANCYPGIAAQIGGLYRFMPGGKYHGIAIQVEPDRRYMGPAILPHGRQLAGPGIEQEEILDLRRSHVFRHEDYSPLNGAKRIIQCALE